ncbi:MAG: glycosyltransferase family 2 protein [Ruminococcaceae bacterium]|nr:glycosyltransferase family 2 protein [Oscillospiraceae bacterium]
MKFSVIIPAYNAEKTLTACLQSLAEQTFSNFEVLIIDDGSSDCTMEKASGFTEHDSRFHYVRQDNGGVSSARNRGMRTAVGDFIVFLDSDDRLDPRYLENFFGMITAHPDSDNFWCGYRAVDGQGNPLDACTFSADDGLQIQDRSQIISLHLKSLDASPCNKAYRRSIIAHHALSMREELSLGEDLLFNYAYLDVSRTKIVISNQPLYIYTKAGNDSLDSKFRADLKDIYDTLDNGMLHYLQKWDIPQDRLSDFYSSVYFRLEKVLYNTYRPENTMSAAEKRRYNEKLMRSAKFQEALNTASYAVHPAYRVAYRAGSWRMIQLLDHLQKIKARLRPS